VRQALARENEQGPEPFRADQARPKQTGGELAATLQKKHCYTPDEHTPWAVDMGKLISS